MDFLVDTHILLWSLTTPNKLSGRVKRLFADTNNDFYYSPLSIWEIAIKYQKGTLNLEGRTPRELLDYIELETSYDCLDTLTGNFATCYELPKRHNDLFDRMFVWEALRHDYALVSADSSLQMYEQDGLRLIN